MKLNLENKVILITGAGRGIGKAITQAVKEAGGRVAGHYNHSKNELEILLQGEPIHALFQADLSISSEAANLVQRVVDKMGRIDVIINNAGIAIQSDMDSSDDQFLKEWNETMAVNLTATALICKNGVKQFKLQKGGILINIASRAAFRGDTAEYLAYAASKGGMVALTRSIARAFGKQGITAFTIAPGFTKTEMADQFIEEYGEEYAINDIALSQLTLPEDIAPTVVFLACGLARHATGATIDINAGSYVH